MFRSRRLFTNEYLCPFELTRRPQQAIEWIYEAFGANRNGEECRVIPVQGINTAFARSASLTMKKKRGGDKHFVVKWHWLVCHVKILWASEKRYVPLSIASGTRNLNSASSSTEGKALIIEVELIGCRISITTDGLGYWVGSPTGHSWIEVYGNFNVWCTCTGRASAPSPPYACLAWVSERSIDRTDTMIYLNQQPNLCYNALQLTPSSVELSAATTATTATTATYIHLSFSSIVQPSALRICSFTNRCHIENYISRQSIQQTGNYMEYSCSCVETTIVSPTY